MTSHQLQPAGAAEAKAVSSIDVDDDELDVPDELTAFNVLEAVSNPKVSAPTLRLLLSLLPRAQDVAMGSRRDCSWTLPKVNTHLAQINDDITRIHQRDWAAAHRIQKEGNMGRTPQKIKGNVAKQTRDFLTDDHLRFLVRCILSPTNRKDVVTSFATIPLDDGGRVLVPAYIRTRKQDDIVTDVRSEASKHGYPVPSRSTAGRLVRWILLDRETQKKGLDNAQVRTYCIFDEHSTSAPQALTQVFLTGAPWF